MSFGSSYSFIMLPICRRAVSGCAYRRERGGARLFAHAALLCSLAFRALPLTAQTQDATVHLVPRTFLRRFVKATGMKPSEYQQRLHMTRAREMLEFSRKNIEDIASSVGYDDAGGFRRVFRKIVGLTPSQYRQRFSRITQRP